MINIIVRVFALIGITLLIPLIFFAGMIIFFEDGLPIFFVQKRIGKNEKLFNIFKVRTMYNNTPNLGTHEIKKEHYLHFGKFLRKFKIDELPQIANFILGDLNLVGPRPGLPNQEKLLMNRRRYNIFDCRPGITGFAQILGFDMSNPLLLAKIDELYIKNKNNKLDLEILIATFFKKYRNKIYNDFIESIELIKKEIDV